MTTEQGIENRKTPPASDNPREEDAVEDTKNDDVSTELRNGIDKLQIESDNIQFDSNITIEKVNIQDQPQDDIHKETSVSTTLITEATNGEERKEKDKVEVSKIIDHHQNVEKNDLHTTQHGIPIVPPQNQEKKYYKRSASNIY